ncbi:hypothetical protein Riv7116_1258 [Rivularia sp. PCC 7116]|nr:hypothetical protein Riv7116_1258 [Rivularia sp. PCC 7116]
MSDKLLADGYDDFLQQLKHSWIISIWILMSFLELFKLDIFSQLP